MNFPSHKFYEDILALFCAGVLTSLGIVIFESHQLLTGGTAGIALIGDYITDLGFGVCFFIVNLPFYYIAWTRLSKRFTINTFITVALVSVMTENIHKVITISEIHPFFSALAGGMLISVGMLIMFRHKSSMGGLGILALYLQNRFEIRAGNFGLLIDCIILSCSLFMFDWPLVLLSVAGAITLNLLIAVNHKPGRYQAYLTNTDRNEKLKVKQPQIN
ncbi:YitT family protein [Paraglaciecola aquimarina]|uniref:YitT family protein n=1 Tax=Paraglaciecola algarum TaxID=3050085 RepID=A0ABS9D5N3_9ALTE|nr:YitT family protein [Paraglaciecola sp. G1-23]MCF2947332.1 YitT family protein [Paraglaciecola sp. G1-23]